MQTQRNRGVRGDPDSWCWPRCIFYLGGLRRSDLATSHSFTVTSWLPLANVLPLGEKDSDVTGPLCPSKVWVRSPDAASHNSTLPLLDFKPSPLPMANIWLSGARAMAETSYSLLSVSFNLPVPASHKKTSLRPPA